MPDVVLITPRVFTDDRGFFLETYVSAISPTPASPRALSGTIKQDR